MYCRVWHEQPAGSEISARGAGPTSSSSSMPANSSPATRASRRRRPGRPVARPQGRRFDQHLRLPLRHRRDDRPDGHSVQRAGAESRAADGPLRGDGGICGARPDLPATAQAGRRTGWRSSGASGRPRRLPSPPGATNRSSARARRLAGVTEEKTRAVRRPAPRLGAMVTAALDIGVKLDPPGRRRDRPEKPFRVLTRGKEVVRLGAARRASADSPPRLWTAPSPASAGSASRAELRRRGGGRRRDERRA